MTELTAPPPATRPEEDRAEARRAQVLDAAATCFRQHGFHNASMAQIARTASMSVGHIYHYFESKEAIIATIVARDEAAFRQRVENLRQAPDVLQAMIAAAEGGLDRSLNTRDAALLMEILAEACRHEGVARIVQESDRAMRLALHDLVLQARPQPADKPDTPVTPETISAQAEILWALFEGLKIRAIRNPGLDRDALLPLLRKVVVDVMALP